MVRPRRRLPGASIRKRVGGKRPSNSIDASNEETPAISVQGRERLHVSEYGRGDKKNTEGKIAVSQIIDLMQSQTKRGAMMAVSRKEGKKRNLSPSPVRTTGGE